MKRSFVMVVLAVLSLPAFAAKSCDELKGEIAKKVEANGVKAYSLEIVAAAEAGDKKVVGSCEGGSKKIVYVKK